MQRPNYFELIIRALSIFSPLLSVWFGRQVRNSIWLYAIICCTFDILNFTLKKAGIHHALVSNVFILTEFILITGYFTKIYWGAKSRTLYILNISTISILFMIHTYLIYSKAKTDADAYNYNDASIFYISYIILSVLGLYKVMKDLQDIRIEKSALFLACVAFLLYASGTFFLLLMKDVATQKDELLFRSLWIYFFLPLNVIKNILLAYSLKNAAADFDNRAK